MKKIYLGLFFIVQVAAAQTTWYVSPGGAGNKNGTNWENAYDSLHKALTAAASLDSIFVKTGGTFKPHVIGTGKSAPRDQAFVVNKALRIYGGFPANLTGTSTIKDRPPNFVKDTLSGDIGGQIADWEALDITVAAANLPAEFTDNTRTVLEINLFTSHVVLDGFVVQGSYTATFGDNGYGGINVIRGALRFYNLEVRYNRTIYSGGGIQLTQASGEVANCDIHHNVVTPFFTLPAFGGGVYVQSTASPGLKLRHLAIHHNTTDRGGGLVLREGTRATHLKIYQNSANTHAGGVWVGGGSTLANSVIYANTTEEEGGGAIVSDRGKMYNCTVYNNTADNGKAADHNEKGGGVFVFEESGSAEIANTLIYGNSLGSGANGAEIYVDDQQTPGIVFTHNLVKGASELAAIQGISDYTLQVSSCVFTETSPFASTSAGANFLRLSPSSEAVQRGDNSRVSNDLPTDLDGNARIRGFVVDIGAYESNYTGKKLFVDASSTYDRTSSDVGTTWEKAYDSLQYALAVALPSDSIFVKGGGVFKPTAGTDRTKSFVIDKPMYVYGGFPTNLTGTSTLQDRPTGFVKDTLSGDIGVSVDLKGMNWPVQSQSVPTAFGDNSQHVVHITSSSAGAILDGFVIEGGYANTSQGVGGYGGGLLSQGTVVLRNLGIRYNWSYTGGGAYLASGGDLSQSYIHHNTGYTTGGGVWLGGSSARLTHSEIANCYSGAGGGVAIGAQAFASQLNIHHNTATGGGGGVKLEGTSARLTHSEIANCSAAEGGGIAIGTQGYASHVRIHHNTASSGGGGAFGEASQGTLSNSILYANKATAGNNANPYAGGGGGILFRGGNLLNCTLHNNTHEVAANFYALGGGLLIYSYLNNSQRTAITGVIANNLIYGNHFGANVRAGSLGPEVFNNNTKGEGPTFSHNLVKGATQSDAIKGVSSHKLQVALSLFTETNPFASTTESANNYLHLATNSPALQRGNDSHVGDVTTDLAGGARIVGANVDIGAYEGGTQTPTGRLYYVDAANSAASIKDGSTWEKAFDSLHLALEPALLGDTIFVKSGTYKPTAYSNQKKSFVIASGVQIYGGFPTSLTGTSKLSDRPTQFEKPILSGDIGAAVDLPNIVWPLPSTDGLTHTQAFLDNSYQVVQIRSTANGATLDGFVIEGGALVANELRGAGLFCEADAVLRQLEIRYNWAIKSGGFFLSKGHLTESRIHHNASAGSGGGGGLGAEGRITHSEIDHNGPSDVGAGLTFEGAGQAAFLRIHHNRADDPFSAAAGAGVFFDERALGTLSNSIIYANTALYKGAGIYSIGGNVFNCTLFGNRLELNHRNIPALGAGLDIGEYYSRGNEQQEVTGEIANTLIYGNVIARGAHPNSAGHEFFNENIVGQGPLFTHNLVKGASQSEAIKGPANHRLQVANCVWTTTSPYASESLYSDLFLRLATTSSALNVGDNNRVPSGITTDLAGAARIGGATVDIGAYEGGNAIRRRFVDASASGAKNGTSWTDAYDSLQVALRSAQPGDSIFVKAGTYTPTPYTDRQKAFVLDRAVYVYGGFPAALTGSATTLGDRPSGFTKSVLSGDIGTAIGTAGDFSDAGYADNSYHVVRVVRAGEGAVLNGFRIESGYASATSGDDATGAGLLVQGDATLSSLEVRYHKASATGGGGYLEKGTLSNSLLYANTASKGGGIALTNGRLYHSTLYNNTADDGDAATHTEQGGGLYIGAASGASAEVVNTLIYGNRLGSGTHGAEVYNANTAGQGALFTHNLVKGASQSAAIQGASGHALRVSNAIWSTQTSTSLFASTTLGASNYLGLAARARAINAGDHVRVLPGKDLVGNAREVGTFVDIGAYESAYTNAWPVIVGLVSEKTIVGDITNAENTGYPLSTLATVRDVDGGALNYKATPANQGKGAWQYKVAGTTNWLAVPNSGIQSLVAADSIRFVPIDDTSDGTKPTLTLKGYDGTAESEDEVTLTMTIETPNVPPTIAGAGGDNSQTRTILEDVASGANLGYRLSSLATVSDSDGGTATYRATPANQGKGTWQYRVAGTINWIAVPNGSIQSLTAADSVRFAPAANANTGSGTAPVLRLTAWDGEDVSTTQVTLTMTITPVADPPTLTGSNQVRTIAETISDEANVGYALSTLATLADVDGTTPNYQITPDAAGKGTWQYKVAGTGNWLTIPHAGIQSLVAADSVRFVPTQNTLAGVQPTLNLIGWDGTSNSSAQITLTMTITGTQTPAIRHYVIQGGAGTQNGATWLHAFDSLNVALSTAQAGDTIFVKHKGTFKATASANRTKAFVLKAGVHVYGGFKGTETGEAILKQRPERFVPDTLSGDIGVIGTHTDNSYHVVHVPASATGAVLNGFVVRHGYANASGLNAEGGGLLVEGNALLAHLEVAHNYATTSAGLSMYAGTLRHSDIHDNQAPSVGGIGLFGGRVEYSDIYRNTATTGDVGGLRIGAKHTDGTLVSNGVAYRTNVYDNTATAGAVGGVELLGGRLEYGDVYRNTATAGRAGGVRIAETTHNSSLVAEGQLLHTDIHANTAAQDGGGVLMAGGQVVNSAIYKNKSATAGGGVWVQKGVLLNSTIYANEVATDANTNEQGGGLYIAATASATHTLVVNTIIYDNRLQTGTSAANGAEVYNAVASGTGIRFTHNLIKGEATNANSMQAIRGTSAIRNTHSVYTTAPAIDDLSVPVYGVFKSITELDDQSLPHPDFLRPGSHSPVLQRGLTLLPMVGNQSLSLPQKDKTGVKDRVDMHAVDIGAYECAYMPKILYVAASAQGAGTGASWPNAFTELRDAISAAFATDTILVKGGDSFVPTAGTDRSISFELKPHLHIYGGMAGTETGAKLLSQRSAGFTPTILSGNIGDLSTRDDNSYHVVRVPVGADGAVLDGFEVSNGNANAASGDHADGGGLWVKANAQLANLIVHYNHARSKGGGLFLSNGTLVNGAVYDNSTDGEGGGIWAGNAKVINATIYQNHGISPNTTVDDGWQGCGLYVGAAGATIANSILYDNRQQLAFQQGSYETDEVYVAANATFTHTLIRSARPDYSAVIQKDGITVTVTNGVFETEEGSIFYSLNRNHSAFLRLKASSPALNAGGNSQLPSGILTDLQGFSRIQGSAVDLGPYEGLPPVITAIQTAPTSPTVDHLAPVETGVAELSVTADNLDNPAITYTILSGNTGDAFQVVRNNQKDSLKVKNAPSYANTPYSLSVRARHSAGGKVAERTQTISIAVVAPQITGVRIGGNTTASVNDPATVNGVIGALSITGARLPADQSTAAITYTITSGNAQVGGTDIFGINTNDQLIVKVGDLPNNVSSYSLGIRASYLGITHTETLTINVVQNVSLTTLSFSETIPQGKSSALYHGAPVDTEIGALSVTGQNIDGKTITYTITAGNTYDTFKLTGNKLLVNKAISYANGSSYALTIRASVAGASLDKNVTLSVAAPVITSFSFSGDRIARGAPIGAVVGTLAIEGTHIPSTPTGVVYAIQSGNTPEAFEIDGNKLKLKATPPANKTSYSLGIQASYATVTKSATFSITVDNIVIQGIALSARQVRRGAPKGTEIGTFSATGTGLPNEGTGITYTLVSEDGQAPTTFEIDGKKLKVKTPIPITKASYALIVQADYSGARYTTPTAIAIEVLVPMISAVQLSGGTSASVNDPPSGVGAVVGQLTITGTNIPAPADQPDAPITYTITAGNSQVGSTDIFGINANDQLIVQVADLPDNVNSYSLTIQASYLGVTRASVITLSIVRNLTLTALNFAETVPQGKTNALYHGAPVDTEVGALSVTGENLDGKTITYAITAGNTYDTFKIAGNKLLVNKAISIANGSSYALTLRASVAGVERSQSITLNVTAPTMATLALSGGRQIARGAEIGTAIGTLSVNGTLLPQNGAGIQYRISAGDPNEALEIDGATLKLKKKPASATTSYTLTIEASYVGIKKTASFTITVNEIAITAIQTSPTSPTVDHLAPIGTGVAELSVTSVGISNKTAISYAITAGNTGNVFEIVRKNDKDSLKVKALPSYSAHPYSLTVTARYTSTSGVVGHVQTIGVNVRAPVISAVQFSESPVAVRSVNRDAPKGSLVGALVIIGQRIPSPAEQPNANIQYSITSGNPQSGGKGIFALNGNRLEIAVADALTANTTHNLTIQANYLGITQSNTLSIKVISGVVLNALNFAETKGEYAHALYHGAPENTEIGALSVTGENLTNLPVHYSITAGNTFDTFKIAGNKLLVNKAIDYTNGASYALTLRAAVAGVSRDKSITLQVVAPNMTALDLSGEKRVARLAGIGTVIGTLSVNGTLLPADRTGITYTIVGGNTPNPPAFEIEKDKLKLAATPPQNKTQYSLEIRANYIQGISLNETFGITIDNIQITDIRLSGNQIRRGSAAGTTVGTLSAVGIGLAEGVEYTIISQNGTAVNEQTPSDFVIQNRTLKARIQMPQEARTYQLVIRAAYRGVRYTSQPALQVQVVVPSITRLLLSGNKTVQEGTAANTEVGTLSVEGHALPTNEESITYTIVNGDIEPATFKIDGRILKINTPPVHANKSTYILAINATYDGVSRRAPFTIRITQNNTSPLNTKPTQTLSTYPNPTQHTVLLKGLHKDEHIHLYSSDGEWIYSWPPNTSSLDLSLLPAGAYVLELVGPVGVRTHTLIKR